MIKIDLKKVIFYIIWDNKENSYMAVSENKLVYMSELAAKRGVYHNTGKTIDRWEGRYEIHEYTPKKNLRKPPKPNKKTKKKIKKTKRVKKSFNSKKYSKVIGKIEKLEKFEY